ncbi:Uncharacterised protein (plasmid) [Legionella adelaidensis]|uniref:Lipoprotein n=1 Tax=Legionella adelaidensis TaxID=45056 RepID=A0A0W0R2N7_9GAMM|nr:hypothetical protein [Legionella adelaidensis]KTC65317.1 hypothetical protein Lade_1339 [Legionella adelaidensis]VEH86032.1 Uncharacterised protein [Legionella adelaidensis]
MKRWASCTLSMILGVLLIGCTTATYLGLQQDNIPDQYKLKVYIGGFSGGQSADNTAQARFKEFMAKNNYTSYKVIDRTQNYVPSYFEYTVKFYRNGKR